MTKKEENPYSSKEFIKLQKEWYKKLEAEGFRDIEQMDWANHKPREALLTTGGNYGSAAQVERAYGEDKQRYYELASQFYWHLKRKQLKNRPDEIELRIWELHAQGEKGTVIAKAVGYSPTQVARRIKKLKTQMLDFKSWRDND